MSDRKEFLFKDGTWQQGMKALCLARSGTTRVVEDRWSSDLRERKAFYLHSDYLNSTNSGSDNYAERLSDCDVVLAPSSVLCGHCACD
ncbi:hypothetical protein NOU13_31935 [Rhodococcus erythropolis]|uniref:hypothetical protein n=1 Tax=Rhodococcus erythropolis TaxID=1833 RepID=UPI00210EC2E4|nr:hypothetical protein [Rhodococcus erythropolis]MCQ4129117.1 hypothetical protein [Rhodococcus erythropolis]